MIYEFVFSLLVFPISGCKFEDPKRKRFDRLSVEKFCSHLDVVPKRQIHFLANFFNFEIVNLVTVSKKIGYFITCTGPSFQKLVFLNEFVFKSTASICKFKSIKSNYSSGKLKEFENNFILIFASINLENLL